MTAEAITGGRGGAPSDGPDLAGTTRTDDDEIRDSRMPGDVAGALGVTTDIGPSDGPLRLVDFVSRLLTPERRRRKRDCWGSG